MLRVGNLSIPLSSTEEEIAQQLLRRLRIPREALLSWKIDRKSVDARDKGWSRQGMEEPRVKRLQVLEGGK